VFPIETPRLLLRPFEEGDFDALAAIYGDPEVMRYVGDGTPRDRARVRRSLGSMIEMQSRLGYAPWAVVDPASGDLIGESGLYPLESTGPEVELTYTFAKMAWGRGYATECGRASLEAGFTALGLERIVAVVYPANLASRRVVEKLGMRSEGLAFHYGADLEKFSLARPEWLARRP
jgi:ribosomal-protein-alanine N-acetyltransferase